MLAVLFISCVQRSSSEKKENRTDTIIQRHETTTTIKEDTLKKKGPTYKIIVAYLKDPEAASEDWGFFFEDIRNAFKDKGVIVVDNLGNTAIIDSHDLSIEIDLTEILKRNNNEGGPCYIFIENDKEPKYQEYNMSDQTIRAAEMYFGVKSGEGN